MNLINCLASEGISLESSLNFITDGLIIINSNCEILMINQSAQSICGLMTECHYTNWPELMGVYKEDRKTLYSVDELPLVRAARGEFITGHFLNLKNHLLNEWKIISCNASPIKENNIIVGAILTFRDLTEEVKEKESIQKERAFYQKVLNSIPAYVFSKDLEGNFTFSNEKLKEDFQKNSAQASLSGELGWSAPGHDKIVLSTKKTHEFQEEYKNVKTGKTVHLRTTRIPLLDHQNDVYGICGFAYDITAQLERRKVFDEQRTKIATASKLAALGMLAAEIGHEINNPLAIIRTSSWIMRRILTADVIQKEIALLKLDEIDMTVARISDIVVSVKNLSRDSSSEEMKSYVLKDILTDIQSICGQKFQSKGIKFILDQTSTLGDQIKCFRVQLSEVFINLIVNAVDAVENCENPWVKVEVLKDPHSYIFRVSDSGAGVSEEIERKIFAPFFSTKELGKGTGLGLSISKEIMRKHNGDLVLNRNVSPSCFEVILPQKRE